MKYSLYQKHRPSYIIKEKFSFEDRDNLLYCRKVMTNVLWNDIREQLDYNLHFTLSINEILSVFNLYRQNI